MSAGLRTVGALLPLVVFWWVEGTWGLRAGVLAAMALAAAELGGTWWVEGRLNRLTLLSAALVGGLGSLSLLSDHPAFFLLAPALGDWVLAAALILGSVRGDGPLLTLLREQDPTLDLHPLERRFFRGVGLRFAANLLLHALAVCWAAPIDRDTWMWVSGPLQYAMFGVHLGVELAWGRLVVGPRVDRALAAETP